MDSTTEQYQVSGEVLDAFKDLLEAANEARCGCSLGQIVDGGHRVGCSGPKLREALERVYSAIDADNGLPPSRWDDLRRVRGRS